MRYFSLFVLIILSSFLYAQSWKPINGTADQRNHTTAFTNATIYTANGNYLQNATLLIKKDQIVAIGTQVEIPKSAVVIDLKGRFIYPSFIELLSETGIQALKAGQSTRKPQLDSKKESYYYWNETIKPEVKAADLLPYNQKENEKLRSMGFGLALTHQNDGLIRGTSALLSLGNEKSWKVLKAEVAQHYSFNKGISKQTYPSSLMGMIALIRQVHYDAKAYENQKTEWYNGSLAALNSTQALPKIMESGSTLSMLRANKIADEFGFKFILNGNGTEYKRAKAIKATSSAVIIPLTYPKPYDVSDPYDALRLPLSKMKEWELAASNAKILADNKVPFAFTSKGHKNAQEFYQSLVQTVEAGLPKSSAIAALTQVPAELMGVSEQVGSIEVGKLANFLITDDTLFSEETKIYMQYVLGEKYQIEEELPLNIAGLYSLNVNKRAQYDLQVDPSKKGFSLKVAEKNTEEFSKGEIKVEGNRVVLSFHQNNKLYRLSGSASDKLSRIWTGKAIVDGKWVDWAAIKKGENTSEEKEIQADSSNLTLQVEEVEPTPLFPNMAFGWDSVPAKAKNIVFRSATVWTNEKEGVLKNSDVLVVDGKIKAVGYKLNLEVLFPKLNDIQEIDAKGLHLTTGIIDEHSHIAISRGVNESGQAVTAEVSIGDVVNSDDINIYRQLAGGVTTSQLLHGSANPIGGQSALIKLRWGKSPEEMKIANAPGFIKFALGENVKQSNWGDQNTVRFPQTRMGVEQVFYDAFVRAKEYKELQKLYNAKSNKEKKSAVPPRYDLELEALAEILDSQRFITCHSYIQSEINMLMHVADSMGFTVNTFTHILEGYKVADKMKTHGAAASTFSDWWAYKYEVNDAIPYNGALLHKHGVLTGFNSDDAEMGRRLNQEAAKAVKYGGVSEEEAWKFVTLNPAKMLHLDDRLGSIKVGKDADLVLWTDHPLSVYAKVKTTYIDGIPYFDSDRDQKLRAELMKERERIIAKMIQAKTSGSKTQKVKKEEPKLYHCDSIEQ